MEGRLGDSLFPAPGSQQRATAGDKSARNKVALRPGHSLMDWIRLTNSGKDLAGVDGKLLDVTAEELAKHCHPHDAWIALKGKVYNVTAYMDFHPGGRDELTRGIGTEATTLFNEVHKWVNFESMLSKCLVGRLKTPSAFLLKGPKPSVEKVIQFIKPVPKSISKEVMGPSMSIDGEPKKNGPPIPKYDWYQSEASVTIVIYNKWLQMGTEHIVLDVGQRSLRALVNIQQHSYLIHLELEGEVELKSKVKIQDSTRNIEIRLDKLSSNKSQWLQLGTPLEDHDTFMPNKKRDVYYRSCNLQSKSRMNHDTFLFSFSLPEGTHLSVPVGHHIHVKMTVEHVEVSRSYTPVCVSLRDLPQANGGPRTSSLLHLMVKVYEQGALTPHLHDLALNSSLCISDPTGTFNGSCLEKCERLVLLAAGTGFTPMVKIIASCLTTTNKNRFVTFLFFNKTEKDILWREQLDSIVAENERFRVHYILSSPDPSWSGARGHIRRHLLETMLPPPPMQPVDTPDTDEPQKGRSGFLIAVCGPKPFTKATLGYLEELGYSANDVFAFTG